MNERAAYVLSMRVVEEQMIDMLPAHCTLDDVNQRG